MSGIDIVGMFDNCKEIDRLRKEQEDVYNEINKIHKKLSQATPEVVEKFGDSVWSKLRQLYVQAKGLAEQEVSHSNALMNQLDAVLQSGLSAAQRKKIVSEQKKKRLKSDSDPPRLSSAAAVMRSILENPNSLIGEQVAAKIKVAVDDAQKDEWIVVKVMRFDRETKEFELLDEEPGDDEDSGQRYKLPISRVIPFPKRGDPSSAPDFPTGKHVLAVFPATTALYKATVVNTHRKRKTDDYLLEFDDDEEDGVPGMPQRHVPFHKVVALPEGHRQ
ncbi:uncharacterized protein LOC18442092 isoform X2 [Amborella trichopoda]|uniref:uncharacterized protein LOC18442092 isoform X2 n=1 Tax=Amborella trichopoda TaxID=13333 RepID=UPI0009BE16C0|nr:uncharacterized protein LOC18442092 isoform X2 [Amborella trichopoda]|eukprot:XP_020527620.1 uncharacterized protein LOC18442092 isoform X2 [Amborella trichopoda]